MFDSEKRMARKENVSIQNASSRPIASINRFLFKAAVTLLFLRFVNGYSY
jgi:hypothetical protein